MHRQSAPSRLAWIITVTLAATLGCGGPVEVLPDAGSDANALPDTGAMSDARSCASRIDCDDGVFCNGIEACVDGACAPGSVQCNDGIACTLDSCDESLRSCSAEAPDLDDDGAADASCVDARGLPLGTDCDDDDANAFPGNTETCDDHDEDCDPTTVGGEDLDLDGYLPDACCNPEDDGTPFCGLDCDDARADVSRLATEVCDGVDNNCNEAIDEGTLRMSWPDADGDGFGDASAVPEIVCTVPSSRADEGGDCDDDDRRVHPFQTEECNGSDDDCNGTIDEGGTAACGDGLTGTTAECMDGRCVITGCAAGRFDCNRIASDGCEPLCSDSNHCGTCGHVCAAPLTFCGGGHCPGVFFTLATLGMVNDADTGAPIAGATITTIGLCDTVTATSAADGSWEIGPLAYVPDWVRIEAPGYATAVQPFSGALVMLPSSLVDAWAADPDAAAPRSPDRAILVVDFDAGYQAFNHDGVIGPGSPAVGADLVTSGGASRGVFFGAVPGRMSVGGTVSDGSGCSFMCGALRDLWLEPGAVTLVGGMSCAGICS